MKKIITWMVKSKTDLTKKWWHRLSKVLFIVVIVVSAIYLIAFLSNSYAQVVYQWNYVDSLSGRLSEEPYFGKVVSISNLYGRNEVISEDYSYEMNSSLANKEYLQPLSPIFLEDAQSENFCSDELYKHISNIVSTNNIKLFSTTNPNFKTLYTDIDTFITYLKNNSYNIKCVMIDSYTTTNDNDTTSKITFLRPVETSKYKIYSYKNNLLGFILYILLSIVFFLICIICAMLIYYKIILYIVYGKIEKLSSN